MLNPSAHTSGSLHRPGMVLPCFMAMVVETRGEIKRPKRGSTAGKCQNSNSDDRGSLGVAEITHVPLNSFCGERSLYLKQNRDRFIGSLSLIVVFPCKCRISREKQTFAITD